MGKSTACPLKMDWWGTGCGDLSLLEFASVPRYILGCLKLSDVVAHTKKMAVRMKQADRFDI